MRSLNFMRNKCQFGKSAILSTGNVQINRPYYTTRIKIISRSFFVAKIINVFHAEIRSGKFGKPATRTCSPVPPTACLPGKVTHLRV